MSQLTTYPQRPDPLVGLWNGLAEQLNDSDFELIPEEFARVSEVVSLRRRRGDVLDPLLLALVRCLERQAIHTDDGLE